MQKIQCLILATFVALFMSAAVADNGVSGAPLAPAPTVTTEGDGVTLTVTGTPEQWSMTFRSSTSGSRLLVVKGASTHPNQAQLVELGGRWLIVDDLPYPRSQRILGGVPCVVRQAAGVKPGTLSPWAAYLLARTVHGFCAVYWALPMEDRDDKVFQRCQRQLGDKMGNPVFELRMLLEAAGAQLLK